MTTAIKVENLSKKYVIRHQSREKYTALRDVVVSSVKNIAKGLIHKPSHSTNNTKEDFYALNDVSFEIKQGERVGIIGRNGAGKSTLLKLLSRITEPSSGKISMNGRVASLLEVGTGFQKQCLNIGTPTRERTGVLLPYLNWNAKKNDSESILKPQ